MVGVHTGEIPGRIQQQCQEIIKHSVALPHSVAVVELDHADNTSTEKEMFNLYIFSRERALETLNSRDVVVVQK